MENDKEKTQKYKEKILVAPGFEPLCQAVVLQENLLNHLATMCCILH